MDATNILAKFILIGNGNDFNVDEISSNLGIIPSKTGLKGELIRNGKIRRKESFWELSTNYELSLDTENQLFQIINQLKPHKIKLKGFIEKYNLEAVFRVVIKIENNEVPAIILDNKVVKFISEIKAEIEFDIYVCS